MNIAKYTDVYFLRSVQILQHFSLNPFVRAQIFIRQGRARIAGVTEVLKLIETESQLIRHGGRVFALQDGDLFSSNETFLLLVGKAQDVIPLETVVLGIVSSATTRLSDHHGVDLSFVTQRSRQIKELIGERALYYFGAPHWHFSEDKQISKAAFEGGAQACSTDEGASVIGSKGVGTIPHSLENIFAWKYGTENAVLKTSLAFDKVIDVNIPRVILVDYANKEIDDALKVAKVLGNKLSGVRVDTCGENMMQCAEAGGKEYWQGKGVTISGVYQLRKALDQNGFSSVKIVLSSGFGETKKVQAFIEAEKKLDTKLFDALGVGNLFNARIATMDIVGVGNSLDTIKPIAKVGRSYQPNARLKRVL